MVDSGIELLQASGIGDTHSMRAHLDAGADIESRDSDGRTPLLKAAYNYRRKMEPIILLVESGADILAKDSNGNQAADYVRCYPECFTYLKSQAAIQQQRPIPKPQNALAFPAQK